MPAPSDSQKPLVRSYLTLRKSIGIIGVALPFVVAIGKQLLESPGLLGSISSYYYSVMGNVFVGSLCAIGVFMWSYRGYDLKDEIASQIAAYSVIGIALFPTTPDGPATQQQTLFGMWHLIFAVIFFSTLIFFALFLFRKTNVPNPTPKKILRNRIFTACGVVMLVCLLLLIAIKLFALGLALAAFNPVFWLESVMIIAFGISWLVKGEAILKD